MANSSLPTGDILSGAESQKLRTFCTSNSYTQEDLDDYANLLANGPLEAIRADFNQRVEANGIDAARQSLLDIAYGPTKIPVYNYILQLTILVPHKRPMYLEYFRYLALEAKVPVDSADLSGNTTLIYSISTKPYLDIEVAEILLQAGADINHRNRYGCVAAHDIVMARDYSPAGRKKVLDALRFFLEKGGDINIADGDGVTAKKIGIPVQRLIPELGPLLNGGSGIAGSKAKKVGRNDPCSCGSKKKYKVCCGKI